MELSSLAITQRFSKRIIHIRSMIYNLQVANTIITYNVIDMIKKSENNSKYRVYAIVAPSISSQFTYAKLGQVITGLKKLGFFTVVEAALGADMVAMSEAKELSEKEKKL